MKTRIAAALSITGVLVAGSAAALVNTQVLDNSAGAEAVAPTTTDQPVSVAASTTSPSVPPSTVAAAVSTSTTAPSTQAIYKVGDSGTVTLDTAGDVLTIVDVEAADGWMISETETEGPLEVEISFVSDTVEVKFRAALLFGVVTTSVETESLSAGHDDDHDDDLGDDHGGERHGGGDDD